MACRDWMRKILIVDDFAVARKRLEPLLAHLQGVEIVTGTGPVASSGILPRNLKPDLVIMDVQMRSGRGLARLRGVKRARPGTQGIVLTNEACPEIRIRCLAPGADCFSGTSAEYPQRLSVLGNVNTRFDLHRER